jgi:t-SNARE complex subunit (syntaxin)
VAVTSGNTNVFGQQILQGNISAQQAKLGAVQDRQAALLRLTKSLEECLALWNELNELIQVR